MKLTSHEEYGLRCLIRLGEQGLDKLTIPEISNAEGIAEAYVGKLLRILRLGGLVTAARGTGGYSLARPANQIVLADVLALLGGRLYESDFCETHTGHRRDCVRAVDCSLRVLWRTVQAAVDDVLRRTTLQDVLCKEQQMIAWVKGLGEFASHVSRQEGCDRS